MTKNYVLVRPMDSDVFFNRNVVAIGWSRVNLSQYEGNSKFEAIQKEYPSFNASRSYGRKKTQINRFCDLKTDDIVIVPISGAVKIGRVKTGKLIYSEQDKEFDQANQIEVDYISNEILRENLGEGFSRRLRVPGSIVLDLSEFATRIEELISNPLNTAEQYWNKKVGEQGKYFKEKLLERIRNGNTFLKAGGEGLEDLIRDLMEIEGYVECRKCAKTEHPGKADADIIAEDSFLGRTIYIQVKHHHGRTGSWGIEQLVKLRESKKQENNNEENENEDYILWTTAELADKDKEDAYDNGIIVRTGDDLVDLIYDLRDRLPQKWKIRLGISDVPMLID